jgi:hypothetical protein
MAKYNGMSQNSSIGPRSVFRPAIGNDKNGNFPFTLEFISLRQVTKPGLIFDNGPSTNSLVTTGIRTVPSFGGDFVPWNFDTFLTESTLKNMPSTDNVVLVNLYTAPSSPMNKRVRNGANIRDTAQGGNKMVPVRGGMMNGLSQVTITQQVKTQPRAFPLEKSWSNAINKK